MDSGKPIKESRDVDVPLAASHFWYYAGWADKLDYAFPGRVAKPLGVAAQIIPWNFPLLMLAWKIAPALAAGNTVVLKPASTTPLSALLFADVCVQADLPPGTVEHRHRPGLRSGWTWSPTPAIDKVAFTGSTEIGRKIFEGVAGTDKALTLELGGKAANIVFDDAPLDQAIEGIVNGIYFNQGEVCCAGSRLLVQESIAEPLIDKLKDRLATIRVGDPLDKNTDVGAINSKAQLEKITELVQSGVDEGADLYQPACDLPERGYFFRPTLFTNVAQSHRIAREEIFGPVLSVLTFRTPEEAVEKANNTPYGLSAGDLDRQGFAHPRDGVADEGRRRLGQHVQPVRPDVAVRRLQGLRVRARGRHARAARLRPPRGPLTMARDGTSARNGRNGHAIATTDTVADRIGVRKTYKLYIGGAFPRSESGRSYLVSAADGTPLANACRASRKDLRDAVRAADKAGPGWAAKTAMNRGQVLYRVAELMEGRRDQFIAEVSAAEGLRAPRRPPPSSTGRSTAGSGTPAGPTRSPRSWAAAIRWRRRTSTSRSRSRPASSGSSRPRRRRCWASSRGWRRRSSAATRSCCVTSETRPLPAVTLSEVLATSDVPGGVVNILTGRKAELVPVMAAHADVDAIDTWGVPDAMRLATELAAAADLKRLARRPTTVSESRFDWLDDRATERPEWIAAYLEMKTVWHPIGI